MRIVVAAAVEYTYRYQRPSVAESHRIALVSSLDHRTESFFEGELLFPRCAADLLLGVTEVVRARFHVPAAMIRRVLMQADPVITCHSNCIRFEGFSSCASAYGRLDLDRGAFDGEVLNCGTTNVDFGPAMRAALAGLRPAGHLGFSIGMRAVRAETSSGAVIERKVKLPVRWLKSFAEVGLYQWRMQPWAEISGVTLRRFLAQLQREAKGTFWIGKSDMRLSQRPAAGALSIGGVGRLSLLKPLARHAVSARIYGSEDQPTAWELRMPHARFLLLLSTDVTRGFSGEGQALSALARTASNAEIARIRAGLRWQGTVADANEAALARCAAAGLLGYDLYANAWFHRELPFDLQQLDKLNPRRAAARALLDAVEIESQSDGQVRAWVRSKGAHHRVLLGRESVCTCPWFNKHGLSRGPCKHVLAVEMAVEADAGH